MRSIKRGRKKAALSILALILSLVSISICLFAEGEEQPIALNKAVDDGLVRINQSKSTGGYSRFMIEMENTSSKPLSVDPYGSAFDPPSGVATQRVGIGLPIKIGDQRVDMRGKLSTDPSQEAPVGAQATQEGAGTVPDSDLPKAAGAAAGAAAIGTLLTGLAQGVRPREALSDLAGIIRGDTEPIQPGSDFDYQTGIIKSYRDQDMTELDYQKQRLDAAKSQGAQDVVHDAEAAVARLSRQIDSYDKNLAELGQKPLEHVEMEKRSFDYTRRDLGKEVKAELADQAKGTISDTDRIAIDLWITDNAPNEQAYNDMKSLADKMVVKTKDGVAIGDKKSILTNLGNELQRTNQPSYTYFEKYALREEVMENAKGEDGLVEELEGYKEAHDDLKDTVNILTGDKSEQLEDIHKKHREAWEADGSSPGGGAMDRIEKAKEIYDGAKTISDDAKAYMAAGNSRTLAYTKAVTQFGVSKALDVAIDKNPALKVVNNVLKYSEKYVGKDITPGKGLRILTDKAFDTVTGELDHKEVEKLDFNSGEVKDAVRSSQIKGLEQRLSSTSLSDANRQDLTARLNELRKN